MQQSSAVEAIPAGGPVVVVAWVKAQLGRPDVRLVDARPRDHYLTGHIPGAVSIDLNAIRMPDSTATGITAFLDQARAHLRRAGVRPDERVVFYEDFSGAAAARGVWMLDALGRPGSAMVEGGLRAWAAAGGSVTRRSVTTEPSDLDVSLDETVLATAREIRDASANGHRLTVLDARSDAEFRSGTISGAIHVEWLRHLRPDGRFRLLAELRALYDAIGIGPSHQAPVVAFCGSGYRSAHTYVVLKTLGVPAVKNYAPSWGEWGRRPDQPVAVSPNTNRQSDE